MKTTKTNLKKEFKEILKKYETYAEYRDMEIKVKYIINLIEEETYIEVELYRDDEEYTTKLVDGFTSQGKCYTVAHAINTFFEDMKLNTSLTKEVWG